MKRFLKGLLAVLLLTTAAHAADINSLSTTDASNSSCWSEGMAPSNVNNCARADLGIIARWYKDWNGSLASSGSSNAYTLSANQTLSAYFDGLTVTFEANHTNSGPATLNIDTVGAATISKYGAVELESGDVAAGQKYTVVYDGSRFQLVNSITPFASTVTSGNIPLFSGTTGRFTDSGQAASALSGSVLTTQGDILYRGASGLSRLAAGTAGRLLMTGGAGANPSWAGPRFASVAIAAKDITSNTPARDDSTPLVSEGEEIASVAITPQLTTSKVKVELSVPVAHSAGSQQVMFAVFRGNTCIGAFEHLTNSTPPTTVSFLTIDSPSTTSATTYSVRAGTTSGTGYIAKNATALYNGEMAKFHLVVTEMLP